MPARPALLLVRKSAGVDGQTLPSAQIRQEGDQVSLGRVGRRLDLYHICFCALELWLSCPCWHH